MSNDTNTRIQERLAEDLDIALATNDSFADMLASRLMDRWEYYLYTKENHWELIFNYTDEILDKLWDETLSTEFPYYHDVIGLCNYVFDLGLEPKDSI